MEVRLPLYHTNIPSCIGLILQQVSCRLPAQEQSPPPLPPPHPLHRCIIKVQVVAWLDGNSQESGTPDSKMPQCSRAQPRAGRRHAIQSCVSTTPHRQQPFQRLEAAGHTDTTAGCRSTACSPHPILFPRTYVPPNPPPPLSICLPQILLLLSTVPRCSPEACSPPFMLTDLSHRRGDSQAASI